MTRDDILRMALESGIIPYSKNEWSNGRFVVVDDGMDGDFASLLQFAAIVAAAVKPEAAIAEAYRCGWEAGAIETRNACIALCEEHWKHNGNAMECADSIRARGKE